VAEPVVVAEPTAVAAVAPVPKLVAPPERAWGEHIVARAPTRAAAPLVTPRIDFVDELVDVTRGL
jgi:hypothetical protein